MILTAIIPLGLGFMVYVISKPDVQRERGFRKLEKAIFEMEEK